MIKWCQIINREEGKALGNVEKRKSRLIIVTILLFSFMISLIYCPLEAYAGTEIKRETGKSIGLHTTMLNLMKMRKRFMTRWIRCALSLFPLRMMLNV